VLQAPTRITPDPSALSSFGRGKSPIFLLQYYLSSLVGLLVIEMVANWGALPVLPPEIIEIDLARLLSIPQCSHQRYSCGSLSLRW
jgi:hypothetical protein